MRLNNNYAIIRYVDYTPSLTELNSREKVEQLSTVNVTAKLRTKSSYIGNSNAQPHALNMAVASLIEMSGKVLSDPV